MFFVKKFHKNGLSTLYLLPLRVNDSIAQVSFIYYVVKFVIRINIFCLTLDFMFVSELNALPCSKIIIFLPFFF